MDKQLFAVEEPTPHSLGSLTLTLADLVGSDEEVPGQEMSDALEVEDEVSEQTRVSWGRALVQN